MSIENIEDHIAKACRECGSVKFVLLKSGLVECHGCGDRVAEWYEFEEIHNDHTDR